MTKSRTKDNICPHCLSKLIDDEGIMSCTGNKLMMWQSEFKRYESMNAAEKKKYLISFSDSEKFVDLYDKWSLSDADGNRPNFTCGYSNQIFSPIPETRVMIPDPLQIKRLERVLRRPLTNEELFGDKDVLINGTVVDIAMMEFPDDF